MTKFRGLVAYSSSTNLWESEAHAKSAQLMDPAAA
jgi:hypothetical protein